MSDDLSLFLQKINFLDNDPRDLIKNKIPLDGKIRNAILKINQTSWCWTLFCCQGHFGKKSNVPYIVFIVKNQFLSAFYLSIHQTMPRNVVVQLPIYNSFWYEISVGYSDENFSIISLHIHKANSRMNMNIIHQSMNDLADSLSEVVNG